MTIKDAFEHFTYSDFAGYEFDKNNRDKLIFKLDACLEKAFSNVLTHTSKKRPSVNAEYTKCLQTKPLQISYLKSINFEKLNSIINNVMEDIYLFIQTKFK